MNRTFSFCFAPVINNHDAFETYLKLVNKGRYSDHRINFASRYHRLFKIP